MPNITGNMSHQDWDLNFDTNETSGDTTAIMYSLTVVVPFTIIYAIIFVSGVLGNVSTCIVIARSKSMHTATNYYLFSLALSDMLLLVSGLPPEMYKIWSPDNYVFGETFCFLQGFFAEMSANATVLTITAFTVERYLAICHPFLSHTMSKLSRVVKYIISIWIIALGLAIPQAIQFGIQYEIVNGRRNSYCNVVKTFFEHSFEISTFVFFVAPMTLITVLYILIGIQLRKSKNIADAMRGSLNDSRRGRLLRNTASQNRVIRMLIAVVAAFFICWAPFHTQRLLAVYLSNASKEVQSQEILIKIYTVLMYSSGLLYFVSTTINPILYHILSNKFRKAFQNTCACTAGSTRETYSAISKLPPNCRNYHRSVSDGIVQPNQRISVRKSSENGACLNHKAANKNVEAFAECHSSSSGFSTSNADSELLRRAQTKQKRTAVGSNRRENGYFRRIGKQMMMLFQATNKRPKVENVDVENTISNSSLKDLDEVEFSNEDLMNYMHEINIDIKK